MIAGSSSSFKMHGENVGLMSRSINILIDSGGENSASFYRREGKLLLAFLTMVTHWSRSWSHFHALIAQNLTGEFTRKIYALSGNLFSDS